MFRSILIFAFLAFFSTAIQAQSPDLKTALDSAQLQSKAYREAFRNLLADELKDFEEFDKNGLLENSSKIKSSFLVYQSGKKETSTTELRNVLEVDGKLIPDSQKRGEEFLGELEKEKTLESELQKLQRQSAKYDRTLVVFGLTLNQAVILEPALRPSFDFEFGPSETLNGVNVLVVKYQQRVLSQNITINEKKRVGPDEPSMNFNFDIPRKLKKEDIYLRGTLYIDATSFQIVREVRELMARKNDPVMILSSVFDYQKSEIGMVVPKTIAITLFKLKTDKNDKFTSIRETTVTMSYSNFRQTNVEVNILDDETD